MSKILIINTGSQSKKYSLFDGDIKKYNAHFEMEDGKFILTENTDKVGSNTKRQVHKAEFVNSIKTIVDSMISLQIINEKKDIEVLGVRIVAAGSYFQDHKIIDKEYVKKLSEAVEKTPLHLKSAIEEIENAKKILGKDVKIIGISDTAFHKTIPAESRYYAIPMKDSLKYDIKKFGYHGISIESILSKMRNGVIKSNGSIGGGDGSALNLPTKVAVCHLGGGASVTAVLNGQSVYNSMGFTPLDGLIMATRVGNIDSGVVAYLTKKIGPKAILGYLNNQCGLLGISGKTGDIRELLQNEKMGDQDSALALNMYVSRLKNVVAEAVSVMGGLDMIIFSGTVGERSFIMRERICEGLGYLGVKIDKERNNKSEGVEVDLSSDEAKVKTVVVKTDETAAMVQAVFGVLVG